LNVSRYEKLAPLTGVVSFVLLFAAAGLYGFYENHPAPEKLQSFFNEHATKSVIRGCPN
jgi:hypothetical protein